MTGQQDRSFPLMVMVAVLATMLAAGASIWVSGQEQAGLGPVPCDPKILDQYGVLAKQYITHCVQIYRPSATVRALQSIAVGMGGISALGCMVILRDSKKK